MTSVSGIGAWLVDGARDMPTRAVLMDELCSRLVTAGLPLDRASLFVTVLHPDIAGRSFVWWRDRPTEINEPGYDTLASESYLAHPAARVLRAGVILRQRLNPSADVTLFPFFGDLRSQGFTDYLATPLHFTNGEVHVVSWATRRAGGFSDEDLAVLESLAPPLARIAEIRTLRRTAETLLDTYLGRQTGARVLAGHVRRGDTESIHAAVWLSDLRGFTALADRLPPRDLIALLNRYFECQVPAIEARGGEVLKFMGDGLLAIFPFDGKGPEAVCAAALAAAREARLAVLAMVPAAPEQALQQPPFSLALHVGEVLYGNVGGGHRLDFTVIGPAVNLAARLERLGRDLGRIVVASAEFVACCGEDLAPLGSFVLRGISGAHPAFGLHEEGDRPPEASPPA